MLALINVARGQQSHLDGVNSGKTYDELKSVRHMFMNVTDNGSRCSLNPSEDKDLYFCSVYSAFDKSLMLDGTFYYSML